MTMNYLKLLLLKQLQWAQIRNQIIAIRKTASVIIIIIIIVVVVIIKGRPMLEHSRFHGSLPLFTILTSSPCRVQTDAECTQIFLNGSRPWLSELAGRTPPFGNPEITARSALEWSIHSSDLATRPKSRRRLSQRTGESCVWLVRLSTSVLVTRWRYEMRRSLVKHLFEKQLARKLHTVSKLGKFNSNSIWVALYRR